MYSLSLIINVESLLILNDSPLCILQAIVAALLMNIYIVGLNQISDIEIDKVSFQRSHATMSAHEREILFPSLLNDQSDFDLRKMNG